jgi:uncharacterized membrane protein YcjF (UPF0283 family)
MSVWEGLVGITFVVVAFIMICAFVGAVKRERRERARWHAPEKEQAKEREATRKGQTTDLE